LLFYSTPGNNRSIGNRTFGFGSCVCVDQLNQFLPVVFAIWYKYRQKKEMNQNGKVQIQVFIFPFLIPLKQFSGKYDQ